MLSTAITAAQPVGFASEDSAFSVLMVNAEGGEAVKRIAGLEAVHGLLGEPGEPYPLADSYSETELEAIPEPTQTEGVYEIEHAARNSVAQDKPIGSSDASINILSVPDATSGKIVRRIEVPGAVHQTAISSDERYAVAIHRSGNGTSVINMMSFTPTVYAELCRCSRVARERSIG